MSQKLLETRHVTALMDRIRSDMAKIGYIMTIIMQVFLFFYYSLSIYTHRNSVIYIIIYAFLLTISICVFTEQIIYHQKYKKKKEGEIKSTHKRVNRIFRYIGLANKLCLLVVSLIPVIKGEASDFDKVATIALAILIIIQLAFIFIAYLLNRYMDWLKMAIELDYKESMIFTLKEPKRAFSDKIHGYASSFSNEDTKDNAFNELFRDELETVDIRRKEKQTLEKEKRSSQLKNDIRIIKGHFKEKRLDKKTSDTKIEKAFLKCKEKAEKLLSSEEKQKELLFQVEQELKKNPVREEMLYIDMILSSMEEHEGELSDEKKKACLINLYYYINPIVDNDKTTKDNLAILERTKEEYGPLDDDKEE